MKIKKSQMIEFDSVVSANIIQSRLWRKETYGYCPINHNPMKLEETQKLPIIYEENSSFYMFNSDKFITQNNRICGKFMFYGLKFPENVDIDTEDDWEFVQKINNII